MSLPLQSQSKDAGGQGRVRGWGVFPCSPPAGDPEPSEGLDRMAGEGVEAKIQATGPAPFHVLSGLSIVSISHVTN